MQQAHTKAGGRDVAAATVVTATPAATSRPRSGVNKKREPTQQSSTPLQRHRRIKRSVAHIQRRSASPRSGLSQRKRPPLAQVQGKRRGTEACEARVFGGCTRGCSISGRRLRACEHAACDGCKRSGWRSSSCTHGCFELQQRDAENRAPGERRNATVQRAARSLCAGSARECIAPRTACCERGRKKHTLPQCIALYSRSSSAGRWPCSSSIAARRF